MFTIEGNGLRNTEIGTKVGTKKKKKEKKSKVVQFSLYLHY